MARSRSLPRDMFIKLVACMPLIPPEVHIWWIVLANAATAATAAVTGTTRNKYVCELYANAKIAIKLNVMYVYFTCLHTNCSKSVLHFCVCVCRLVSFACTIAHAYYFYAPDVLWWVVRGLLLPSRVPIYGFKIS